MTEKEKRTQMAGELNEIVGRIVRDAGVLLRAMAELGEDQKTLKQIAGPLKRYGGEHGQAYGGDVLKVVKNFAPAKKPRRKQPPKPPPLPANVTPLFQPPFH